MFVCIDLVNSRYFLVHIPQIKKIAKEKTFLVRLLWKLQATYFILHMATLAVTSEHFSHLSKFVSYTMYQVPFNIMLFSFSKLSTFNSFGKIIRNIKKMQGLGESMSFVFKFKSGKAILTTTGITMLILKSIGQL